MPNVILYFWMNKTFFSLVLLLCFQSTLFEEAHNEKLKETLQDSNAKGNWQYKIKPIQFSIVSKLTGFIFIGQHSGLYQGPYFSGLSQSKVMNLTAGEGQTIHLPCRVNQLGTASLSWVRTRDSTIISIDTDIITHDKRFMIVESSNRESWVLIIRYDNCVFFLYHDNNDEFIYFNPDREVTPKDAGYYECQISTEPKMSRLVHLKIMGALNHIIVRPSL